MQTLAIIFAACAIAAALVVIYAAVDEQWGEAGMSNAALAIPAVLTFMACGVLSVAAFCVDWFWRGYQ